MVKEGMVIKYVTLNKFKLFNFDNPEGGQSHGSYVI